MKRRNLLRNMSIFIFAFIFGYAVKKDGENMVLKRIDSTSDSEKHRMMIADEIKVIKEEIGKLASVVHVEKFASKTPEIDDTNKLQRAFDYIKNEVLTGKRVELVFQSGANYIISKPLVFNYHSFCTVHGSATITVSNKVSETKPLPYMLDMAEFSDINKYRTGSFVMRDIKFNANNRAVDIIRGIGSKGYGLKYTTFDRCEFVGLKKDGVGIHGVSWVTNVENCRFVGFGEDPSKNDNWGGLGIRLGAAPNGVYIRGCDFTRLQKGIYSDGVGKVTILGNVFDNTQKSAITIVGGRGVNIEDNYFEAVGRIGETVKVYQNEDIPNVKGVIVVTGHYRDWTAFSQGVQINKNVFANCLANDLVVLDNAFDLSITENTIHSKNKPHNSLVKLLKYGVGHHKRVGQFGLYIAKNNLESYTKTGEEVLVEQIIDYSALLSSNTLDFFKGVTLSKIVIEDVPLINNSSSMKKLPANLYASNFINDREEIGIFKITREIIKGETVYAFLRTGLTTRNKFISLNNKYLNRLKGNTVRFVLQVANTQADAGLRFSVKDGVNNILYLPSGNQIDKSFTDSYVDLEFIFNIDKEATELSFKIDSNCSSGQSIYIKNFAIIPAGYSLSVFKEMDHTIFDIQPPIDGTWVKGDKVLNSSPSAGGFEGWICTKDGSPGTWKGFGAIQA
ncbi:right-handed parallel beta-helix repeat-containing protein [Peribacillus simplex]|uniref:right-handed parallel beta-helix repeat-containing protein n=1 Tax=Peribacillus simplex TaxID=1478 RepID=UPI00119EAEB2|nr:right-handed parallel beta-helix repeat-containing protein [Peribacillus simplex]